MNEFQRESFLISKKQNLAGPSKLLSKRNQKKITKGKREYRVVLSIEEEVPFPSDNHFEYAWMISASLFSKQGTKPIKRWNDKDRRLCSQLFYEMLYGVGIIEEDWIVGHNINEKLKIGLEAYSQKMARPLTPKEEEEFSGETK